MISKLFALRGQLSERLNTVLIFTGLALIALTWLVASLFVPSTILPSPMDVIRTFPDLHFRDAMIRNLGYSIYLNYAGYIEAIAICIPLGFIIGLFPIFRQMFNKPIDAFRFIPLTAVTGLFIVWFGIGDVMKIQFLAFGIIVYLLPVVVQRINDVPDVYQQTAFTLGASKLQTIISVFIPAVISKLMDDIRVLVAISWTYIIVAEMVNKSAGIGGMIYTFARQGRIDKVFALIFLIILVGFIQDKLFTIIDKQLFPHKHMSEA